MLFCAVMAVSDIVFDLSGARWLLVDMKVFLFLRKIKNDFVL